MTPERDVELIAKAICKSGKFECGQGCCAPICMENLGEARSKCGRCVDVHGKLAGQIVATLQAERDAAVAQERERCAKIAESLIDPMSGSQYEYGRDFAAQNIASMIRNRRDG